MQVELLKSHIQEVLKPFGKLVKDCKIRITKTKIANSDEYEIDIDIDTESQPQKLQKLQKDLETLPGVCVEKIKIYRVAE
ncbi:MAG: hypothetical protein WCD19_07580 [Nitrososphaeraceae archaeon]